MKTYQNELVDSIGDDGLGRRRELVGLSVAIHVDVAVLGTADVAREKVLLAQALAAKAAAGSLARLRLRVSVVAHAAFTS